MVLRGFSIPETGATQTQSIPEWSTRHFEATGRPLRIAVDQANWWYRNITAAKDAEIKTKSPGSHPREKRIMERIFYLLRMNIQLIFIFDGRNKPPKKWPAEYSYSESNVRLLKELLDQLGVPRHDAPGDSAAECVRLQDLGIVDAIWTDNTDALMFGGSPTLVQFHKKPEGDQFKKSNTVKVTSAASIREGANLTREWFLMYATLVGCGYTNGLAGFDATRFFRFAQHSCFQAAANLLAAATETPLVLSKWRITVANIIAATFPDEDVTAPSRTFPDLNTLRGCAHPVVSPDDVLRDLPCLRDGWFRPYGPDMLSRYRFLLSNFNTRIHESWIARDLVPIELNHRLRETSTASGRAANRRLGISARPKRRDAPGSAVTVDPLKVLPELRSAFPSEMYRVVNGGGSRVRIEAPAFRPEEMVLLDCVLRRGLPDDDDVPRFAPPLPLPPPPSSQPQPQPQPRRPQSREVSPLRKRTPPIPPPKNESSRNFQQAAAAPPPPPAKRRPNPERPPKSGLPVLPPINTHLPLPPLHALDTSSSPTCIHFHDGLTLPGELDWHNPPLSPLLAPSPLAVSRRASALAVKLSGPEYRKASIAITSPLPMLKQPVWDHAAAVDLTDSE
ncbi:PIN domain-like protein [Hypoxylon argillaceum]|nr:PIN domain-like protein [Hypoxylon argillaceum]